MYSSYRSLNEVQGLQMYLAPWLSLIQGEVLLKFRSKYVNEPKYVNSYASTVLRVPNKVIMPQRYFIQGRIFEASQEAQLKSHLIPSKLICLKDTSFRAVSLKHQVKLN